MDVVTEPEGAAWSGEQGLTLATECEINITVTVCRWVFPFMIIAPQCGDWSTVSNPNSERSPSDRPEILFDRRSISDSIMIVKPAERPECLFLNVHSRVGMRDKGAVVTNHLPSVFVHLAVFILQM